MGWLDGIRGSRRLRLTWEYSAKGRLWRLLPASADFFLGEDRNIQDKSVSFFCVNQTTGSVQWSDVQMEEPWWIGMESIHKNYLIVHEFASPSMPDHKKIHAIDIATGKPVWSNEDVRFLFGFEDSIYAARDLFESREYVELDLSTGEMRGSVDAGYINVLRETIVNDPAHPVHFPDLIHTTTRPDIASKMAGISDSANADDAAELLDLGDKIVLSFHEQLESSGEQPLLRQHILVYDNERNDVLFQDIMNDRTKRPVPDSLFRIDNFLYYIAERQTLRALDLRPAARE